MGWSVDHCHDAMVWSVTCGYGITQISERLKGIVSFEVNHTKINDVVFAGVQTETLF